MVKDTGLGSVTERLEQPAPTAEQPAGPLDPIAETATDLRDATEISDVGCNSTTEGSEQVQVPNQAQPLEDGKKRKVALHVAYIGAGYAVSSRCTQADFGNLKLLWILQLRKGQAVCQMLKFRHACISQSLRFCLDMPMPYISLQQPRCSARKHSKKYPASCLYVGHANQPRCDNYRRGFGGSYTQGRRDF